MGIAPLQLPGPLVVPQLDWSGLNSIGDTIGRYRERERENKAFEDVVNGIGAEAPAQPAIPGVVPPGTSQPTAPRGLRNNNFGNIKDGPFARSLPGYKGDDGGGFAVFESPQHGMQAMDSLLEIYGRKGAKSIGDVISRWAPASDGNNVGEYAKFVANGGDPNAPLDLSNPEARAAIAKRMTMFENGIGGFDANNKPILIGDRAAAGAPREGDQTYLAQQPPAAISAAQEKAIPAAARARMLALFKVGTPTSQAAAYALLSKYIGKQDPIKLSEGDILVDPNNPSQVVGRAPGKSQTVREGGAVVQDGKLVYQSPDRPQNVAPGGTLVQNGKPVYQSPANKHLQEVELEDGTKIPVVFDPASGGMRRATADELAAAKNGELPPEVNAKIVKKERSEAFVANEQAAVANAKAAADLKPLIDQAAIAYERATKAGAVGQVVGSPANRVGAKYLWGGEAEKARQDYERALAAVQARITAAQNKGQGAVSDFERRMYAMQFPDLQAADPAAQIDFLKQLQESTNQTIESAKSSMLGKQPSVTLDRPPVRESAPRAFTKDEVQAARQNPEAARQEARDAIAKGAPRDATLRRLQQLKISTEGL